MKIPDGGALSPLEADELLDAYASYVEDLEAQIDELMLAQAWRDGLRPERDWLKPLDFAATATARQRRALEEGRARRKRRVEAMIATLRPEFDRLRKQGHSLRRAAELLGERTGYNPETIRKRLR